MTDIPYRSPETKAITAWVAAQTHQPVLPGLRQPTDPGGWQGPPGQSTFVGYHTISSVDGGDLDGDISRPSIDADRVWQITSWGADADQAEQGADTVMGVLLGPLPVIPALAAAGRALKWIRADVLPGAARKDPDQPSLWAAMARYRIATTPLT